MLMRIAIGLLLVMFAVARIEKWLDDNEMIVVAAAVALGYLSILGFGRMKGRVDFKPEDDDDGGIDWRADAEDAPPQMVNGWAVLLDDCVVFEAKRIADRLEGAGIRCQLEILHEDRAFHWYGNGGLGTSMRVLVSPSDFDRAKRTLTLPVEV